VRTALPLLLLLCIAALAHGEDATEKTRVFVEVETARETYFVGEHFTLRLRVGFDGAWFEQYAVPLFRQEMDVPLQVEAPWLRALAGAAPLAPITQAAGETLRFALKDRVVEAERGKDRQLGDHTFTVLEIEKRYRALSPGEVVISAPTLRFAHATRFEKDFLGDRLPLDRQDTTVRGATLPLRIEALPESGRPAGFQGAIGRFEVSAKADRAHVDQGKIFHLTLVIEGRGNLESIESPRLDDLSGFHVYGQTDEKTATRRTVHYEMAAIEASVREIPAIALSFYDRTPPAGYRTVKTQAIPLLVRADPARTKAVGPEGESDSGWMQGAAWVLGLCALLLFLGITLHRRRRQAPTAVEPEKARLAAARSALQVAMAGAEADLSSTFSEYLAAHLDSTPAAVVGADLPARLEALGAPRQVAQRAATILEFSIAARYGSVDRPNELSVLDADFLEAFERAVSDGNERPAHE